MIRRFFQGFRGVLAQCSGAGPEQASPKAVSGKVYRPILLHPSAADQIEGFGFEVSEFLSALRKFGLVIPDATQDTALRSATSWLYDQGIQVNSVAEVVRQVERFGYKAVPIRTIRLTAVALWLGAPYIVMLVGQRIISVRRYSDIDLTVPHPEHWMRSARMQGQTPTREDFPEWGAATPVLDDEPEENEDFFEDNEASVAGDPSEALARDTKESASQAQLESPLRERDAYYYFIQIHLGGGVSAFEDLRFKEHRLADRVKLDFMLSFLPEVLERAKPLCRGMGCIVFLRRGRNPDVEIIDEWEVEAPIGGGYKPEFLESLREPSYKAQDQG